MTSITLGNQITNERNYAEKVKYAGISTRKDVWRKLKPWLITNGFVTVPKGEPSPVAAFDALLAGKITRRKGKLPAWEALDKQGYRSTYVRREHYDFVSTAVAENYHCFSHFLLDLTLNWTVKP